MKKVFLGFMAAMLVCMALCVGASATEVSTADALTGDSVELNGEYKLIADITIDRSIVINKEKSVTLDLNGHVLNLTDTSGGDSWITVEGGGNLTITDSSPTVPHNFEPNADGLWVLDDERNQIRHRRRHHRRHGLSDTERYDPTEPCLYR